MDPGFEIFLTDNGSLRPRATRELRRIAAALAARTGRTVRPVSLLHAHKVDPQLLDGEPATIVKRALRRGYRDGRRRFLILPLFLGPSRALTDYLPEVIGSLAGECPEIEVRVAAALAGADPEAPDPRLARLLADSVLSASDGNGLDRPAVALVDHGTPEPQVNRVRETVARQLAERLGDRVCAVTGCAMERRTGDEYAFNEPMLEDLHRVAGFTAGDLVLAMFFLLPGRHAGDGGDVAQITASLQAKRGSGRLLQTPLLGEQPGLLDILGDRLSEALKQS